MHSRSSVFRKDFEELINWLSSIIFWMIIRAMWFSTLFYLSAWMHFIIQRMVLLLFPTMRVFASIFMFTSISISLNEVFGFPLRTLFFLIIKDMRFASKVLPIMCINTSIPWMVCITVWTPHSFKMKHVEISVLFELVQKVYCDFIFGMSKCTHITIVTWFYFIGIGWTEFNFVFFWMVKLFNSIMRSRTAISHWTFKMVRTI